MKCNLVLAMTILVFAVGCGSPAKSTMPSTPSSSTKQLDPSGNWLFTVTDSNGTTLMWGEDLFELAPPAVTSNTGVGWFGPSNAQQYLTMGVTGTVSGTSTITYTATGTNGIPGENGTPLGTLTLTGTIADSQTASSGTWTTTGLSGTNISVFPAGDSGTWTAQLLAPITGSYAGTLTGNGSTISLSATLSEDVSQTSTNLGDVTGSISINGSPCFNSGTPLALYAEGAQLASQHIGEWFFGYTMPDANGQSLYFATPPNGVDPNTTTLNNFQITVQGGTCDGQQFIGSLSSN